MNTKTSLIDRHELPRRRTVCLLAMAATIALGLGSRAKPLPGLLAEHTGDALYATMAFFGFAALAPSARRSWLWLAAFGFAALIECSQLLRFDWLDSVRRTGLGRLVLGQGFKWADFVAYAAGATLGAFVDRVVIERARNPRH